jgi:hypothetical protein
MTSTGDESTLETITLSQATTNAARPSREIVAKRIFSDRNGQRNDRGELNYRQRRIGQDIRGSLRRLHRPNILTVAPTEPRIAAPGVRRRPAALPRQHADVRSPQPW